MKANVNKQLEPLCVPMTALHEDERNAKKHSVKNLQRIKRSLKKYGMQKPIVTVRCSCDLVEGEHAFILAGNGTFRTALELGWEVIPRVEFPDERRARAYAVADNRSSEGGGWDRAILDATFAELQETVPDFDVLDVGFEDVFGGSKKPQQLAATKYSVIVDFDNEREQAELLSELEDRGLPCRLLIA